MAIIKTPSVKNSKITELEFRTRFTNEEKIAIYTAAKSNVSLEIWLDELKAIKDSLVDLNDPRTISGVQALEAAGLIGSGRAAEILSY